MGRWSRAELEDAFATYRRVALEAGESGNWDPWADLFTPDATYIEHVYGTMGGREAIRRWITTTMATYPGNAMPHFPVEWYIIDEERAGSCARWNRLADPGDGSLHQQYNFTLLKYAGDGCGPRGGHLQPGALRHGHQRGEAAKTSLAPGTA
jgi:hypothetical protein